MSFITKICVGVFFYSSAIFAQDIASDTKEPLLMQTRAYTLKLTDTSQDGSYLFFEIKKGQKSFFSTGNKYITRNGEYMTLYGLNYENDFNFSIKSTMDINYFLFIKLEENTINFSFTPCSLLTKEIKPFIFTELNAQLQVDLFEDSKAKKLFILANDALKVCELCASQEFNVTVQNRRVLTHFPVSKHSE
ncbi:MAG TPA: hypothetical protein VI959_04660 [Alphaproteobacteria bacterium]|nr:hypothetical protein [Alphaproteobacteria bacterium]